MLTIGQLRPYTRPENFERARVLWRKGKLKKIQSMVRGDGAMLVTASVEGNYGYMHRAQILLSAEEEGDLIDYSCNCYEGTSNNGMCRHCAALAIYVIGTDTEEKDPQLSSDIPAAHEMAGMTGAKVHAAEVTGAGQTAGVRPESKTANRPASRPANRPASRPANRPASRPAKPSSAALAGYMASCKAAEINLGSGIHAGTVRLVPKLSLNVLEEGESASISCQIGITRMYAVRNMVNFVHGTLAGEPMAYGKNLSFVHSREMLDEESRSLFLVLETMVRAKFPDIYTRRVDADSAYRQFPMNEENLSALLTLYLGRTLNIDGEECEVKDEDPKIEVDVFGEEAHGANFQIPTLKVYESSAGLWVYYDHAMYRCTEKFREEILTFFHAMGAVNAEEEQTRQYLSASDYETFCGKVLPQLEENLILKEENVQLEKFKPKKPVFEFYLTVDDLDALWMRPIVRYGDKSYPLFVTGPEYREFRQEYLVRDLIAQYFDLTDEPELVTQANEEMIYHFLNEATNAFMQFGTLYYDNPVEEGSGEVKKIGMAKEPNFTVGVKKKGNLIDLNVECEDLEEEELKEILQACKDKKKYYKLKNGQYLSLEDGVFKVFTELADGLDVEGEDLTDVEVPLYRAQFINEVVAESDTGLDVQRSADFKQMILNLQTYNESGLTVPEGLNATLRPYQEEGYRWMASMADLGLGGILADDMGLGKTLQVIALLTHLQVRSLIVCPASLLYNWGKELDRFSPGLSVELIRGKAADRETLIKNSEALIYVTSYDYLKRDVELYQEQQFGCIVIDEAQEIRNPQTQSAKAVKAIRADLHFAMTGTPIANHLMDLWSIFDFLMPGYLYTHQQFHKQFELPIGNEDENALVQLRRMAQPFMLRRTKEDVLKDLPEKVETVTYVELTGEQRLLYRYEEQQLRNELLGKTDEELKTSKIEFLTRLNRLRQYCCDPGLHVEGYEGSSGKVDVCLEMLNQAKEGGHHVLLFSQFTSMLEILKERTDAMGMKTLYLSGRDSKEQRQRMVEQFQTGEYLCFFISLKAGGTGLTLTMADQVIHFDPWWNAAAEDQATDRAHRFGQKNTVFVTKLVAKDTIEERIVEMQLAKKEMSNSVMSGEKLAAGRLDREELLALLGQTEEGLTP